jgi:hypothetical protein
VIIGAALCPGPPLLAIETSGADSHAARLREATMAAVASMIVGSPDLVAVVGWADRAGVWPVQARADLRSYGPPVPRPSEVAPLSVGIGALMLDRCGYGGPLLLRTVSSGSTVDECRSVAAELAGAAASVSLLVVADGSARRTAKAPGYFDPRAEPYDRSVEEAIAAGELGALRDLDPGLADELMASGWAPLQVLSAAFMGNRPQTTVHYADAPYGVGYLVATLTPA